jgi:hypothetical protein
MLFEYCAECRRCCNVEEGHPPLEVTLTDTERKRHGSICIEDKCTHLGNEGCTLGSDKPFSCSLYPLSFNPHAREFYFDTECPLHETYVGQLADKGSEASAHLASITDHILKLEKTNSDFLVENHAVDIDYFDLIKLPHQALPKRPAKKARQ